MILECHGYMRSMMYGKLICELLYMFHVTLPLPTVLPTALPNSSPLMGSFLLHTTVMLWRFGFPSRLVRTGAHHLQTHEEKALTTISQQFMLCTTDIFHFNRDGSCWWESCAFKCLVKSLWEIITLCTGILLSRSSLWQDALTAAAIGGACVHFQLCKTTENCWRKT